MAKVLTPSALRNIKHFSSLHLLSLAAISSSESPACLVLALNCLLPCVPGRRRRREEGGSQHSNSPPGQNVPNLFYPSGGSWPSTFCHEDVLRVTESWVGGKSCSPWSLLPFPWAHPFAPSAQLGCFHHTIWAFFTANPLKCTQGWSETHLPGNDQLRLAASTSTDISWGHLRDCEKKKKKQKMDVTALKPTWRWNRAVQQQDTAALPLLLPGIVNMTNLPWQTAH